MILIFDFYILVNKAVRGNDLILQRQVQIGVDCLGFLYRGRRFMGCFPIANKPGWSDHQLKLVD